MLKLVAMSVMLVAGGAAVAAVLGAPPDGGLKPGDPAPGFALAGSDGQIHRLADLRGKTVVLAWFPKAFTGG